jgi:hypothetical protein
MTQTNRKHADMLFALNLLTPDMMPFDAQMLYSKIIRDNVVMNKMVAMSTSGNASVNTDPLAAVVSLSTSEKLSLRERVIGHA